jgi:hypothetical protein
MTGFATAAAAAAVPDDAGVPENTLALSIAATVSGDITASLAAGVDGLATCAVNACTTLRQLCVGDVQSSASAACDNVSAPNKPALAATSARHTDAPVAPRRFATSDTAT